MLICVGNNIGNMQIERTRYEKAMEIAHAKGQIRRIDDSHYSVLSQSGNGIYNLIQTAGGGNVIVLMRPTELRNASMQFLSKYALN